MAFYNGKNAEELYDKYADMLYRIALTHSHDSEDAMDAVQDVFVKCFTLQKIFFDEEHCKAWLIRATINRCHDITRKKKVRSYVPLDEIYDVPEQKEGIAPDLKSLLDELLEKYKDVVVLHYLEGFSIEECAKILSLSVSAVKMRLMRAREFVKQSYTKEELYD
ncbi:MAG: RNA polymerase sigma factor [Clostridia bacterium]|nr:RNA polymerase sigma factor [Clostridia bacterium]